MSFLDEILAKPPPPKTTRECPPEGDLNSRIMIIGESPGAVEIARGVPFCGPSGHLLDSKLATANIHRSKCYITNAVKRQLTPADVASIMKFELNGKIDKGKDVLINDWMRYKSLLIREIQESSASTIIALGNLALVATTGLGAIMKRRGSVLPCKCDERKKVVAAIHPSACLRDFKLGHLLTFDLVRAAEEAQSFGILPDPLTIILKPDLKQTLEIIQVCRDVRRCAFDLEVLGAEISCFSLAWGPYEGASIALIDERGHPVFTEEEEIILFRALRDLLEDPTIQIIGQNVVGFDFPFMLNRYGIATRNIADTMVGQAILWPDFPKGLDFITSIYTRYPYYKDDGKKYMKVGGDIYNFWEYNAKDAIVCFQAMPKILDALQKMGNMETYERVIGIYEPLLFINYHGMRMADELLATNEEGKRILVAKAEDEVAALTKRLHQIAGFDLNPRSPQALMKYFYSMKGVKPFVKKGNPTTDVNALKRLKAMGFEEADILLEIRKKNKLISSYLNMKFDDDNRLRSAMNPVGTETGRLSSSQTIFDTGGNIQNLPPSFKKYILADEGMIIVNQDLSQAENRLVALLGPEPRMLEAFETGKDIHSLTASLLFQARYPELTADRIKELNREYEDWPKNAGPVPSHLLAPIGNGQRPWRYWGKQSNHALNYKLGPDKFALHLEITRAEAEYIRNRYFTVYPGVVEYQNMIEYELRNNGSKLKNLFGRVRRFMDRMDENVVRQGCAFMPQSTVADKINEHGMIPAYKMPYLYMMNQNHDAIQYQLPLSIGFDAIASIIGKVKESLEQPVEWRGRYMIIPADTKIGLSLGKMLDVEPNPDDIARVYEELTRGSAGQ